MIHRLVGPQVEEAQQLLDEVRNGPVTGYPTYRLFKSLSELTKSVQSLFALAQTIEEEFNDEPENSTDS